MSACQIAQPVRHLSEQQTSTYSYLPVAQDLWLQTIHHKYRNGATLSKFDDTYDAVGNILTWRQQADTTAVQWSYGYDAADQLTRERTVCDGSRNWHVYTTAIAGENKVRRSILVCLICFVAFSRVANGQPGDRVLNLKAQVLDALFPIEVEPRPYLTKMALRFGDENRQIIIVVYPGRKVEFIQFRIADVPTGEFERLVSKAVAESPGAKAIDIAETFKVQTTRSSIDYDTVLRPALEELATIRLSPRLPGRIGLDQFSEFDFWYDTWQESVHYTLIGPYEGAGEDALLAWMVKLRATIDGQ
jgi:YD repeat-containing protein